MSSRLVQGRAARLKRGVRRVEAESRPMNVARGSEDALVGPTKMCRRTRIARVLLAQLAQSDARVMAFFGIVRVGLHESQGLLRIVEGAFVVVA